MRGQLHIISTGKQAVETFTEIVALIHEEIDVIHIREKTWTAKDHITALRLLEKNGVPFRKIIINDRVDIAHIMGVKGVQIAHHSINVKQVKEKFPQLTIGCSIHSIDEARQAEKDGADFILYGHVFPTQSKPGLPAKGIKQLASLVDQTNIPVIAIGGITPQRVKKVMASGAQGVAVLSGVLLADNPQQRVKEYQQALQIRR